MVLICCTPSQVLFLRRLFPAISVPVFCPSYPKFKIYTSLSIRRFVMVRAMMFFVIAAFFVSTFAGCILVDGHPRGHAPWGQVKKDHGHKKGHD